MAPIATGNGRVSHAVANPAANAAAPVNPTAARHEQTTSIKVQSPNVTYDDDNITTKYSFQDTSVDVVQKPDGTVEYNARPVSTEYQFRTGRKVPKTG